MLPETEISASGAIQIKQIISWLSFMFNESKSEKAKITKPATLHWLRHSYATHLFECGADLRYIQELLGYKSSSNMEIYTRVSTKNLQNIKSPFDYL